MKERQERWDASKGLCFSSFRLDPNGHRLSGDCGVVPLRPKTFAVLSYLVEHAGRVVTRDELLRAVWPDTTGAEKAPKRCIFELRAALGDRADEPRFVETVGRFGYRFVAPLAASARAVQAERDAAALGPASPGAEPLALVGRDEELSHLHHWLDEALNGDRHVVFVTGEPGIGKTSLVETFLRQARRRREVAGGDGDLWIGRGQCIGHYGDGEAYLPLLEAVGRLAVNAGKGAVLESLRRYAPTWLAQLPALLSEAEMERLQARLQGATAGRMLREIVDALHALAAEVPLVLALEDLHWSDYSTLDFVSSVAQRRDSAKLLLIATYRSAEVGADHPLWPVAQELLSHGQAHELSLSGIDTAAVNRYLDDRFPHHAFPARLGEELHRRTEGNPLFLVNLVDDLLAQEILSEAGGRWRLRVAADAIAARVPPSSRRLIEKQMARVAPESQTILEAASVAGVEFTAEAIASALQTDVERVEERCDDLVRHNVFLWRVGAEEWPDGTQTVRYAFAHAIYQQLWYERVSAQRRQRLHLGIGERKERAYGEDPAEVAGELAVHFEIGRDHRRAVDYHYRAAQSALRRSAHREAIDHLRQALKLLGSLRNGAERARLEAGLRLVLGVPLAATRGYAVPEIEESYARALALSERLGRSCDVVQALLGLWVYHFLRGNLRRAVRLAERCLREAGEQQAADLALDARNAVGDTRLWLGDLQSAREHLEQGLRVHAARSHRAPVLHDATDPGVGCLANSAWVLWHLGYADRALQRSCEALALAEQLSHPYSRAYAQSFAAVLHFLRREERQTCERAAAAMKLATEQGFPFWSATASVLHGWAVIGNGGGGDALRQIQEGLAALQGIGADLGRTAFLALLGESHGRLGQADEGLRVLAEARRLAAGNGERLFEAELHRLTGELALQATAAVAKPSELPKAATRDAERHFLEAIEVARKQRAKSWELRACLSLARLWQRQEKTSEARALLSPIHGWFSEGFATADLREAGRLLAQWSARSGSSRGAARD